MIREYAIEPELVIEWLSKADLYAHTLREGFGVGTSRLLSRYPPHGKKLLSAKWEAEIQARQASATTDEARGAAQILKMKGDVVLEKLMLHWLSREGIAWDPSKNWLANALQHSPEPLQTIVVHHPEGAPVHVLHEGTLFDSPEWNFPRSRFVPRDATALAETLAPFLSRSTRLVFVDPYFRPERDHMLAFKEFLRVMVPRPGLAPPSISIHTHVVKANQKSTGWDELHARLRREIEPHVPAGWTVVVRWLDDRNEYKMVIGEEFHNRYILSERGGLMFGKGLDAGTATQSEDVAMMERDHYEKRWIQHTTSPLAFNMAPGVKDLLIVGKPKPVLPAPRAGTSPRRR